MADEIERLSVAETARRLGVSTGTVHRRIRSGALTVERESRPQGSRLWVLLPSSMLDAAEPARASETHPGAPEGTVAVEAELRAHIETLRSALEAEQRAGAELRQLLGREQDAHRSTRQQLEDVRAQLLLGTSQEPSGDVSDDVSPDVSRNVSDVTTRRGFWRRLFG